MWCPPALAWHLVALLLVSSAAQAQLLDSGAAGLPALAEVGLAYAPQRAFVVAARGGYGFIEEQEGATGAHHRGLWRVGLGFSPAPWLSGSVMAMPRCAPSPTAAPLLSASRPS